jgi:DNA-binding response OmpR family regulator
MKILIIEDEHTIAEALRKGLMQEKYSVDLAYDGQAGYEMAGSNEYDLIILDLMLPKMDGMDICLKLRAEEIHTPILMLTAKYQIDDRVAGLNAGMTIFLNRLH